jgi:uncharacterized membrane protein/uncharacterized protein YejL (UPF0352 family)/polyhydroxyalkanoate synthesis regulator phasin
VGEPKVKLKTEDLIEEKLENEGSVIVVGLRLSGLTTLYQNYSLKFPEEKLCLEYVYSEDDKNSFIELMNSLGEGKKIMLIAPEYLYEIYFEEYKSEVKDGDRLRRVNELVKEIKITHEVSREEARKYLEELIETVHKDYKNKFDDKLKDKILDLVKHEKNYPLKLLRHVFDDVIIMMQNKDKEYIKDVLNKKINQRREAEKLLGVSTVLWSSAPIVSNLFGIVLSPLYPVLLAVGTLSGELIRFIKEIWEKKAGRNPFGKVIELKKYWDSLNESERKMLCYKLDSKYHLVPGKSEEYLESVFGDELKDLEEKIEEAKTYVQSNLGEFLKKLEDFEKNYGDKLNNLAKLNEDIKDFKDEIKSVLEELRKLIEATITQIGLIETSIRFGTRKILENGDLNPLVKVEDGKLKVYAEGKYWDVRTEGKFGYLTNQILNEFEKKDIIVIKGHRGIGKSVLGATITWKMLQEEKTRVIFRVDELPNRKTELWIRLKNKINEYKLLSPLIIYDPSSLIYVREEGSEVPLVITETISNLLSIVKEMGVKLLIILPEDFSRIIEDLRLKNYVVEVSLKDETFLSAVLREYSKKCALTDDVVKALVREILNKFDAEYTLATRLAGQLISEDCQVDDVTKIIEQSEGKIHKFITWFINYFFDIQYDKLRAKTLVEIFAIRRPFAKITTQQTPLIPHGIVELIDELHKPSRMMNDDMVNWLVYRQHDLIEETIKKILDCVENKKSEECKNLGDSLRPWKDVNVPKIETIYDTMGYFIVKYGGKLVDRLKKHKDCWKRFALITGCGLAGHYSLPRIEYLPEDVVRLLDDALKPYDIDDYLLVDNEIPLLAQLLIHIHGPILEVFLDKYNEAVNEIKNILNNARNRGGITYVENFYWLGLVSIVALAVRSAKDVSSDVIDATLNIPIASSIQGVASTKLIKSILDILESVRDIVPQRYLAILCAVSTLWDLTSNTARLVFNRLNYVLYKHHDEVKRCAWPLVYAVAAYANLLSFHSKYFDKKVEEIVEKIIELLIDLDNTNLGIIAWANAVRPALVDINIRKLMVEKFAEKGLQIEVVRKAYEIIKGLNELEGRVRELLKDEAFIGWVESSSFETNEDVIKMVIQMESSALKHSLARYKLENDELDESIKLFDELANVSHYLSNCDWALRAKTISGSLVGNELVGRYAQLFSEALKNFEYTALYRLAVSLILGNYLVSLALTNDIEKIGELLEKYWAILNAHKGKSVLTRLMLNTLLNPNGRLSDKLKVSPKELIEAFEGEIGKVLLPALMVAHKLVNPDDGVKICEALTENQREKLFCKLFVLAAKGEYAAMKRVRESLINASWNLISSKEKKNLLKRLCVNDKEIVNMFSEFEELVYRLSGEHLVELIATEYSYAQFALMLYALVNGNYELVKAHMLCNIVGSPSKLLTRLFLEAYKACCDLSGENFRKALARLFFCHV